MVDAETAAADAAVAAAVTDTTNCRRFIRLTVMTVSLKKVAQRRNGVLGMTLILIRIERIATQGEKVKTQTSAGNLF